MRRVVAIGSLFLIPLLVMVIFLLFVLPTVSATSFYHGWVYPGDTFKVRDEIFSVSSASTAYKVLLDGGGKEYLINYNDCSPSEDGFSKYCYEQSDYMACQDKSYKCPDDPDREDEPEFWCCPYDVSHISYEAGKAVWGVYLAFYDVTPVLTVKRSVEYSTLPIGESAKVLLTFKNDGEKSISNALYSEYVPENFSISAPISDFKQNGQMLTSKISLNPGQTKKLIYTVTPKAYTVGKFTGNLSYEYMGEEFNTATSTSTITVPIPYIIKSTLEPTTITIGQKATYTYKLTNNDKQQSMDATINFSGLEQLGEKPQNWHGTLEKGESKTITLSLEPHLVGTYPIVTNTTMIANEKLFNVGEKKSLTVSLKAPTPELRLSSKTVESGKVFTLRVLLKNSGEAKLKDVLLKLTSSASSIAPRTYKVVSVAPGEYPLVAELNLTAPEGDSKLTFTLTGTYKSIYDELFTLAKKSAVLTINPVVEPYLITQSVNPMSAKPGEIISVSVSIKNQQNEYHDVSVTDNLEGEILSGLRQKEMSLDKGETRSAYEYTARIPTDYSKQVFPITTKVFDHQSGLSHKQVVEVAVEQPVKENKSVEAPPTEPKEEHSAVEKKTSLWTKIVNFFKNLF